MQEKRRFGEILIENGYLTLMELNAVLHEQERQPGKPIGQLCVEMGLLSQDRLDLLLHRLGRRLPLGEMLQAAGLVNAEQVVRALEQQARTGGRLGEILVRAGVVSEPALYEVLTRQFSLPFVPIDRVEPAPELKALIKSSFAAQYRLVPIGKVGSQLTVALSDPTLLHAIRDLEVLTGLKLEVVLAPPSQVAAVFQRLYGRDMAEELEDRARGKRGAAGPAEPARGVAPASPPPAPATAPASNPADEEIHAAWLEDSGVEVLEEDPNEERRSRYTINEDSPIVQNIVQAIIRRALAARASDVHLEPTVSGPRLRLRVDGVLQHHNLGALHDGFKQMYRSVVSRLKIVSQLDITEKRRPQDGSFRMMMRTAGQLSAIDFRVSTMPSRFGESMVIRVLDQQRAPRSLESLGLAPEVIEEFDALLKRPTGIILLTGPTGSGKSSTLYAALRTVYQPGIKILTAEDPIEYTHPGIVQAEVNATIQNTFARYLRSFLRQDPDVIMVGEIRDAETAEMALRAAQTGHLLLSTLHTNNASAAVQRLSDLDMDPNSIASVLIGVLGQRLVRKICGYCVGPYRPERYILDEWFARTPDDVVLHRGRGCDRCAGTGFHGRVAVAELWSPGPQEVLLINKRASVEELRAESLTHMRSMGEDALRKALAGITTLEEAFRIVPYQDVVHARFHRSESVWMEMKEQGRLVA